MTTVQTLSSGFTSALNRLNPVKSLQTPKTKTIAKQRDKAAETWRELVEASHREKTEPEAYVIERLASELGLESPNAVATFQADVTMFGKGLSLISRKARVENNLVELYQKHSVTSDVSFAATMRAKREKLEQERKENLVDFRRYEGYATALAGHNVGLSQIENNTRLFPHGIVETFTTTTKEKV